MPSVVLWSWNPPEARNPVDVHLLSRNPFYGHAELVGAMVGIQILVVVVTKLGVLVAGWMLLLVLEPLELEIGLAAFLHDSLMNNSKIRHNILSFSADVIWRIKNRFHIGTLSFFRLSRGTPWAV